ncbi:Myb-like_DNA-binding domain-containing protein [Hexamita inflata]|uniref:Myb-like DNA-binding domain-containing protein n=1 Tax=Hexamita inflata TaxID=28002 RepID=A0AA86RSN9_9EUKA|nr:Myb-like DNA-binding domain-containing protein [Hexamita inflata]
MNLPKQYKKWNESENIRLTEVVKLCKTRHNTINWKQVQLEFPEHTSLQLKSQYSNRQQANPKTYHSWTEGDLLKLMVNVITHGENWSLIKKQFSFYIEESTIKARWYKFKRDHDELRKTLRQLELGNICEVKQADDDLIGRLQSYVHTVDNRMALYFGKPIQPTEYDLEMGTMKINEVEVKPVEMFLYEFDIDEIKRNLKVLEEELSK